MDGGDARERAGLPGRGPTAVITDLGIREPDPVTRELTLTCLHPGASVDEALKATGWDLKIAAELRQTEPPTPAELEALRDLLARTRTAHGEAA